MSIGSIPVHDALSKANPGCRLTPASRGDMRLSMMPKSVKRFSDDIMLKPLNPITFMTSD